jgi:hypothetical protein
MKKLILILTILFSSLFCYAVDYVDHDGVLEVIITASSNPSGITGYELVFYNLEDEVQLKVETDVLFWRFEYGIEKPYWVGKTLKLRVFSELKYSDANGVHKELSSGTEPITISFASDDVIAPVVSVK